MVQLLNIAGALQPLDLGQTFDRIDRGRMNALARMMQQQQMAAQQRQMQQDDALGSALQNGSMALAGSDAGARQNALAALVGSGARGASIALPLLQQERENAEFRALMGGGEGYGAPMPPQTGSAVSPSMPAVPAQFTDRAADPLILQAAAKTGLPPGLLLAVDRAESGGRQSAVSPKGATGRMQLMPGTARDLGVDPNNEAQNVEGGARYLKQQIDKYGNLTHALAAYNWGPGNVDRWLQQGGDPSQLPAETRNYIARITRAGMSAPAAAAPPPSRVPSSLTPERLFAMAASGNPRAMEFARTMAPMMARENPNFQTATIDGNVVAFNPQNPSQRMVLGKAGSGSTESVVVPDPSSPTGFRYAPRDEAARGGMAAPAPEGYRPERVTSTVSVLKRDENGRDIPGTSELISTADAVGRTPADRREDPTFDRTKSLRQEFNGLQPVKDFLQVQPQIQALRQASNVDTRAADLDIVFAFAKMLDPASVVREGEQVQVLKTGGIFDTLAGYANGLNGGARLTPDIRKSLLDQAESRFTVFADNYDQTADRYRFLAERAGIDPQDVAVSAVRPNQQQPQQGQRQRQTPAPSPAAPPPEPAPQAGLQRPANGWTVRDLRNLDDAGIGSIIAQRGTLTNQEKAALAAELNRRASRVGAADGRG